MIKIRYNFMLNQNKVLFLSCTMNRRKFVGA